MAHGIVGDMDTCFDADIHYILQIFACNFVNFKGNNFRIVYTNFHFVCKQFELKMYWSYSAKQIKFGSV